MTPLEIVGNAFNLGSVWLARRNSIHTWWMGMIGVTLYGILFFQARLYADTVLQVFFFGTCIVGWIHWARGGTNKAELPISTLTSLQRIGTGLAIIASAIGAGSFFYIFTNAAVPYADSYILGGSVIAQLLMMRRKMEHWFVWITVDIVAVCVYAFKALYLTAGVYGLFLLLCIQGVITWRKLYGVQTAAIS